jgi:hypothetical protein
MLLRSLAVKSRPASQSKKDDTEVNKLLSLINMANFDSIHEQARSLPLADRLRLARLLLEQAKLDDQSDEIGVGQRGLAAWSDSARAEDWSEFYPASLRKRKVG